MLVGISGGARTRVVDVQSSDDGSTPNWPMGNGTYRISLSSAVTIAASSTIVVQEIGTVRVGSSDRVIDQITDDDTIVATAAFGAETAQSASFNTKVADRFYWLWLLTTGALRFSDGYSDPGNGLVGRTIALWEQGPSSLTLSGSVRIGTTFVVGVLNNFILLSATETSFTRKAFGTSIPAFTSRVKIGVQSTVTSAASTGTDNLGYITSDVGGTVRYAGAVAGYSDSGVHGATSRSSDTILLGLAKDPAFFYRNSDNNSEMQVNVRGVEVQL